MLSREVQTEDCGGTRRSEAAGAVQVTYFTDPLCCWSWAFEPQWLRLRCAYGAHLTWRYRMGGMIADWDRYDDPLNTVNRPSQMGPVWMEAQRASGMPLDARLWTLDPPASSHPACVAVKAAEMQSTAAGERYLRRVREAAMSERRNVARIEVLTALAEEVAETADGGINPEQFQRDLKSDAPREAFREDVREARYLGIGRFPALTLRRPPAAGFVVVGYRPYQALQSVLLRAAPELRDAAGPIDIDAARSRWGPLTDRERAELEAC